MKDDMLMFLSAMIEQVLRLGAVTAHIDCRHRRYRGVARRRGAPPMGPSGRGDRDGNEFPGSPGVLPHREGFVRARRAGWRRGKGGQGVGAGRVVHRGRIGSLDPDVAIGTGAVLI